MPVTVDFETKPEVFTKAPSSPKKKKVGQLTDAQVRQYFEKGYVLIEEYFDVKEELDPVREDIKLLVEGLAQTLHEAGKITKLYREYGLFQRLTKLDEAYPGASIVLHKNGKLPPSFRALWASEKLLNMAEQLLGSSDIIGHPVWNLRTKTPRNEATTVPWHQDVAYLDKSSYTVLTPTAWIPLLDANENNGCMQVVSGGHTSGKVAIHQCCHGGTHYVMLEDDVMKKAFDVDLERDVVTCPVPYGGLLLINNLIPHRSLNNLSDDVRWSLDLRWQRAEDPIGFFGLKDGIRFRSSKGPIDIDWDTFEGVDRTKVQESSVEQNQDHIDPIITGPWMKTWEIVHHNRHTEALELQEAEGDGGNHSTYHQSASLY